MKLYTNKSAPVFLILQAHSLIIVCHVVGSDPTLLLPETKTRQYFSNISKAFLPALITFTAEKFSTHMLKPFFDFLLKFI
jgi:hypothetical protein